MWRFHKIPLSFAPAQVPQTFPSNVKKSKMENFYIDPKTAPSVPESHCEQRSKERIDLICYAVKFR